jgi:hypothetical protein
MLDFEGSDLAGKIALAVETNLVGCRHAKMWRAFSRAATERQETARKGSVSRLEAEIRKR